MAFGKASRPMIRSDYGATKAESGSGDDVGPRCISTWAFRLT